ALAVWTGGVSARWPSAAGSHPAWIASVLTGFSSLCAVLTSSSSVGQDPGSEIYDGVWPSATGVPSAAHTPELPRRWEPSRWVSTTPRASIRANIVVGPTKRNPRRLSSAASAADSGLVVGTSAAVAGIG